MTESEIGTPPMSETAEDDDLKMPNSEETDENIIEAEPLNAEELQTDDLSNHDDSLQNQDLQQEESTMGSTSAEAMVEAEIETEIEDKMVEVEVEIDDKMADVEVETEDKMVEVEVEVEDIKIAEDSDSVPDILEISTTVPQNPSDDVSTEQIVDEEPILPREDNGGSTTPPTVDSIPPTVDSTPPLDIVKTEPITQTNSDIKKDEVINDKTELANVDPRIKQQQDLIENGIPSTILEVALFEELSRKESHVQRLSGEVMKLKAFISKRKQTYKRKRKDEGAPTRALSAYNIFVQDRFSRLAKENEAALKSADSDAQLKRVPPASLVASTGNQWKELTAKDKSYYEDRYVLFEELCRNVN